MINKNMNVMSIKKHYLKEKSACKVTFNLVLDFADRVNLTGNFNDWDIESIPLKKSNNGKFSVSIELEKGKEYQFKYLVDGTDWANDMESDKFIKNKFQTENSVIII